MGAARMDEIERPACAPRHPVVSAPFAVAFGGAPLPAAVHSGLDQVRARVTVRPIDACNQAKRLLTAGLAMLLEHGYNGLGIQALLAATGTPKGSFYHHFRDKEDFALQVIDQYTRGVHAGLDACLGDTGRLPLDRVRRFFEMTQQHYRKEGYMGCLMGGLGQELSGVSEVFRRKIEECFSRIADRVADLPGRGQAKEATSPPIPMLDTWRACWLTAGKVRRFGAGYSGTPRP